MKKITMLHGFVALLDDEDYKLMNQCKWHSHIENGTHYAERSISVNGKRRILRMHRVILGLTYKDGIIVDHINRNGLDNRKINLRIATYSMNSLNCKKYKTSSSGFRGVHWRDRDNLWEIYITVNKKLQYCGRSPNPITAAMIYDCAAIRHYGKDAITNFPRGEV
jgi:hypothetical protein